MPYSEIPDPIPTEHGTYSVQADVVVSGAPDTQYGFGFTLYGGMPSNDPIVPGALDEWFQALVDHLNQIPGLTSLNAQKAIGLGQQVTPTETP